jgi:hypothetical protein
VATALAAIEDLERRYAVDGPGLRTAVLAGLSKVRSPETARGVADAYALQADLAAGREDYDAALALIGKAETSAKATQDPAFVVRIQTREKELTTLRDEWRSLKSPLKTLEEKPDDPAANLAVGLYRCFTRNDWSRGAALLAKGSDAALAALAKKELAGTGDAVQRMALGDAWKEAGDKKSGPLKTRCLSRALTWYEKALPELAILDRVRVEGVVEALYRSTGGEAFRKGLVFWMEPGRDPADPYRDLAAAAKGTNNGATLVMDGPSRVVSFARGSVDFAATEAVKAVDKHGAIFAWLKPALAQGQGYVTVFGRGDPATRADDFNLWVGQRGELAAWFNRPENNNALYSRGTVKPGAWAHCGVVWDDATLVFYLDGKEDSRFPLNPVAVPVRRAARISVGSNPGVGPNYYPGLLGSIHVYNRTLPAAEAMQLYMSSRSRFR